jgi:hypothetical protein
MFVLAISILCSVPVWADSIEYDVNAWATITAPTGASEKVDVSFLWQNNLNLSNGYNGPGIVSGSLDVSSSGFLGTFAASCSTCINSLYLPMFDRPILPGNASGADEVDLYYPLLMTAGTNTVQFDFMDCVTATCTSAYGKGWGEGEFSQQGIQQGSTVSVNAPDGDSSLLLMLSALVPIGAAYRWRSQGQL